MSQVYDRIISLVKSSISDVNDGYVQFSGKDYKPFNFDRDNFHKIEESRNKTQKITFIDGGSSEIIKSSNFSLDLIRVYCTVYQNNKRINSKKQDFYAFVSAKNINEEIYYNVEFISLNNEHNSIPKNEGILLNSMDDTIKQGAARANISYVSNVARRFSEIKMASGIIGNLDKNDIIVLDGSLQCTFTDERKYFEELYKKASEIGVIVCGLSKTTALMTDMGNSVNNALNKLDIGGKWVYYPVVDIKNVNHAAEMAFIKLQEKSRHIFRFEIYKRQKEKINYVAGLLSKNANDPVFIGYPYGLIEADKNARISEQEKGMMLALFSAKFGKDWEKIKQSLTSINAHEILDNIS